jgi:hypothetical protein
MEDQSDKTYDVHLMLPQLMTPKSMLENSMLNLPHSMHSLHINISNNGLTTIDFTTTKNMVIRSTCFPH